FFFQAEDGIRDGHVTGVQTCALPILVPLEYIDPVALPGEAPLFLMYSSGPTGKPKGAQHGIAGYLSYVTATSKWILDIHPEDVYWCMADIGWITGHSYIVYCTPANAATTVLYERLPTFPGAARPCR